MPVLPTDADDLTSCSPSSVAAGLRIRVPQRGDKRTLMETVARNAAEALIRHKTTRGERPDDPQPGPGGDPGGPRPDEAPLRIECYDISNLQGTEVVASMVVFEDGLPRKSEYRRFVIRPSTGRTTSPRCTR